MTLRAVVAYFLGLGTWGFGGPAVLVEHMRRDLVERRAWFTTEEYKEGLALAQIAPGPLAAQLAIYLGWVRGGFVGATLVGVAFVMPSFVMVMALSAAYVQFGGLPWMQGAFYGVGAAVIALIAHSAWRLARKMLGADRLLWAVLAVNALVTAITGRELLWVFIGSGVLVLIVRHAARPSPSVAVGVAVPPILSATATGAADTGTLVGLFAYFAKAGAFVFGSGLAIVPFLYAGVVRDMQWLTERQFLDAVAVSMMTPGPVVITVAFIGFLVHGPVGATLAALGVFLPAYGFVVVCARWFRQAVRDARVRAAVDGVTAAAAGAIAGAAYVLGRRAIIDTQALILFCLTMLVLVWARRVPDPVLILVAAGAGLLLKGTAP